VGKTKKLAREVGYWQARCQLSEDTLEELTLILKEGKPDYKRKVLEVLAGWTVAQKKIDEMRKKLLQLGRIVVE